MKQVSFTLLILILISPIDPIQGQSQVIDAWLTKCFKTGFQGLLKPNSSNEVSLNHCESTVLPKELTLVVELTENCLEYYKLGCQMARLEIFCNEGIKQTYAEGSCFDVEIDLDVTNRAFECCISCKEGIKDFQFNGKCFAFQDNYADRSRLFCCKQEASRLNVDVNITITESTLSFESANTSTDDISKLLSENDIKINSSLSHIMGDNLTESITLAIESVNDTSKGSVTSITIEPETKVDSNVSESDVSPTTPAPISTTEPTPTPTPTPTPVDPPSTISVTVRASDCPKGYQLSQLSNECEDIDECSIDGSCPDSKCFNFPGDFKCCLLGQEIDLQTKECFYVDYCNKKPCFQSDDDQHYCVNYFTGRKCIDKIEEGYRFLKGESGIMELMDKSDETSPQYLELTVKNVTLPNTQYENHGLIYVRLPKEVQCQWNFRLDNIWSPARNGVINEDRFQLNSSRNQIKVWINGRVAPQSIATSVTCYSNSKNFYRNKIYFTFNPAPKN